MDALARDAKAAPQRCQVTGPVGRGENSYVFRVEIDCQPSPVAVKLCLDPKTRMPSPSAARDQFDALQKVHRRFGDDPDYGVPCPIPILTEHGYLVSEWIQGISLTDMFFDFRFPKRELPHLAGRAGTWLRRFHDCRRLPAAPLLATEFFTRLCVTLDESGPLVADDPVARQARQILAELAESLETQPLPRAWLHGDFKSDNLLVSGRRLVGMDLSLYFENVVLRDLVSFLTRLELLSYHPRGLRLLPLRRAMAEAFIAGYVGDGPAIPLPALAWMRLHSAMSVWATRAPMLRSGPKRWYAGHCFRRLARRLCGELSAVSGRTFS